MAASALIPSLFSIIMDPGPHPRYSLRVYYLIAAGFMALSAVSLAIIEVWDLGRAPEDASEYIAKVADNGGLVVAPEPHCNSGHGGSDSAKQQTSCAQGVQCTPTPQGKAAGGTHTVHAPLIAVGSGAGSVNRHLGRRHSISSSDSDHMDAATPLLLASSPHGAGGAGTFEGSVGPRRASMVTGYSPGVSVGQAVRDTLHAHRRLIAFMAVLCWNGSLIFGWQPGIVPYLVPNGRPLVTYQVCGQVADVIGRGAAGLTFFKGKQLHASAVQTLALAAMLVLAFACDQHQHWFTPAMTVINSVFTFAYGVAATRILMSADDFVRQCRPTPIGVERVLQLMGASTSLGSGIGGVCVYFVVKALF